MTVSKINLKNQEKITPNSALVGITFQKNITKPFISLVFSTYFETKKQCFLTKGDKICAKGRSFECYFLLQFEGLYDKV